MTVMQATVAEAARVRWLEDVNDLLKEEFEIQWAALDARVGRNESLTPLELERYRRLRRVKFRTEVMP